ncbi:hypothetical protein FS749_016267 [Ceratobasidium sp. UAMH 11750]|nr:hypothetical protein FS749_016267 [Ceratobasidium sp. UAMH 11750]
MADSVPDLASRLKAAWRQHYPADPPSWTPSRDMPDLTGKVVFVTGGSSGIGFEMCKALLLKGATVYLAGRHSPQAQISIHTLNTLGKGVLKSIELDLASLDSTRTAAEEFLSQESKLDILINNAAEFLPPVEMMTSDGYDLVFGVNCVANCFLTLCLLPCLLKTPNARIVSMASEAHRWIQRIDYSTVVEGEKRRQMDPLVNYGQSKLGLMLFTNELHRRYHKQGLVAVSLHPGTIKSNCYKHKPYLLVSMLHMLMYPASMGAITPLWAATSGEDLGGRYCLPWARVGLAEKWAEDPERMKELWSWVIDQTERFQPSIAQFRE